MHLRVSVVAVAALLVRFGAAQTPMQTTAPSGWEQVLASVNLAGDPRIHLVGAGEAAGPDWTAKIEKGAVVILEGESPLAASLGFRPTNQRVTVTSLRDVHGPKLRIVLERPLELSRWNV